MKTDMTFEQSESLGKVIDQSLDNFPGGTVPDIVNWICRNRRRVVEENFETLSCAGLAAMVRQRRKTGVPAEVKFYSFSLCLDFGLPWLDFDSEISIPRDMENPINSVCDWKKPDDATIDDIDKHLIAFEAQRDADSRHAACWMLVRQAAIKISGGRTDITLGELRKRARESQKEDE